MTCTGPCSPSLFPSLRRVNENSHKKAQKAAWYHRPMQKQSWLFLTIGFILGFAALHTWTKQRAPDIVRARPSEAPAQSEPSRPSAPPVDMARVRQLQDQVKSNPRDFQALVELGNINFDQRNFQDAMNWYSKALAVDPNNVNVRTDLGMAMFYSQQFDAAVAEFNKSLALNPTHPETLFNMGVALLHGKNDPEGALRYWEKLVETNPNHPQAGLVKEQIQAVKQAREQKKK